jgi:hypothetical protein
MKEEVMKNKISEEELKLFSQLRRGGIPLDEEVVEAMKAASRGLSMHQIGTINENTVFDLEFGMTGYLLSVAIYNDAKRIIRPREIHLEMAWPEPQFRWVEDPSRKIPKEFTYSFPPGGPEGFEREDVLNHRLGGKGRLCPGDCLDGFLLGVGQEPIPEVYRDRQIVQTRLSIFDEQGNRYESRMKLAVSRGGQLRRRQSTENQRGVRHQGERENRPVVARTKRVAA